MRDSAFPTGLNLSAGPEMPSHVDRLIPNQIILVGGSFQTLKATYNIGFAVSLRRIHRTIYHL
jgi:hypothetical protein